MNQTTPTLMTYKAISKLTVVCSPWKRQHVTNVLNAKNCL